MAAYCGRPTCVAITVLLLQLAAYAKAADPYLKIEPAGDMSNQLTKPVHSTIFLTCKPEVDNLQLVRDMQWFDPQDRVIDSLKLTVLPLERKDSQMYKPDIYTEMHEDGTLSLFFNPLEEKHAGKYTCKGTYSTIPMSSSMTMNPIIAITWDNAPENQYPILGDDYAVQCQVRARPSPDIIWEYNGKMIKTDDHYVIEPYALKIKNVQESDNGIYTCRATVRITGEVKTRDIRVEVHTRPTITEISNPVDIIEGTTANIECKTKGKPPPTISWVKSLHQQNLSNIDRFSVNPVTGVLTIVNVHRDDMDEYTCIAQNRASTTSSTIQVNVIIRPKIMEFENKTTVEGQSAKIMCKAYGQPTPIVTFRKLTVKEPYVLGVQSQDDRIIVDNERNGPSGEVTGILTIQPVFTDNDGLYECRAHNKANETVIKIGHLTVEFPPSFRNMPNVTVWTWLTRPVNLTCIAESIPNATIEWTWNNNQKIDSERGEVTQIGYGPVSILNIKPADRRYYNNYKCTATNKHGKREHMIELREAMPPGTIVKAKMSEMTATTIKFELTLPETRDLPIETITVEYRTDNPYQQWTDAKNKTWVVGSVYVIEHLKPQTRYEFRFRVANQVGMSNWSDHYLETMPGRTVPNEPHFIIKSIDYEKSPYSNQYELSWVTPPDNGEVIDKYLIKYCQVIPGGKFEVLENTCEQFEVFGQGRTKQFVKGLKSDKFYRAELQAHNAMGYGKPGFINFKTARESAGSTVDYSVISDAGDTCKIAVAAITAAVMLLSLAI